MVDAPCKNCTKRVVGCHSTCDEYKAFAQERDAEVNRRWQKQRVVNDLFAIQRKTSVMRRRKSDG